MSKENEPDEFQDEDDTVLELCALVEEYKEALEALSAQHAELEDEVGRLRKENEYLKDVVDKQSGSINRLDDSVNQLMEDIEVKNSIIESKDSDLQSLQHCLGVIHRRKVEVDDQTQLEQSKIIEKLFEEKNNISEAYSANLKILEDYLEMINARDSEIMDLRLVVQSYEDSTGVLDLSDGDLQKDAFSRPASTVDGTPVRAVQLKNIIPSPPLNSPPRTMRCGLRNAQMVGSNNISTTLGDGPSPSAKALAHIRAASAAAVRRSSSARQPVTSDGEGGEGDSGSKIHTGDEDDDEADGGSPTVPITINRSRVTKLSRHSTTGTLTAAKSPEVAVTPEQKAAALQKYRKYASMHSINHDTNKDSLGMAGSDTVNAPKWSDVGKHERLFDKVDIIKDRNLKNNSSMNARADVGTVNSVPLYGNNKFVDDDGMDDSFEFAPESMAGSNSLPHRTTVSSTSSTSASLPSSSLHSALGRSKSFNAAARNTGGTDSVRSSADGIVEVFMHSDSSNPATPERQKPNKPLFKPPFSKPVFNEFTGNNTKNTKAGNSTSSGKKSSDSSAAAHPPVQDNHSSTSNRNNFPSKAKFDAYVNRKGSSYEVGDKDADSDSAGQKSVSFSYGDSKAVTWADAKGTSLALGYEEYERDQEDKFSGSPNSTENAKNNNVRTDRKSGAGLARGVSTSAVNQYSTAPPPVKENGWLSWRSSAATSSAVVNNNNHHNNHHTNNNSNNSWEKKKTTTSGSSGTMTGSNSPNYTRL